MENTQVSYQQAEKEYNASLAKYEAIMIAYEDLIESDQDAYEDISMEAETISGLHNATIASHSAKNALITWAKTTIENNHSFVENKELLNALFAQMKYRPSIEKKVIDLCMQLEQN